MKMVRRVVGALLMVGLFLPSLAGAEPVQNNLCDLANGAEAGTRIQGYTVVYGTGGSGNQIVLGYGGEYLSGGSGDDVLCAWGGGNVLDGGSGNDLLMVMEGTGNELYGGSGNDTLIGYEGDVFDGGSGRNEIVAIPTIPEIVGTWEGMLTQPPDGSYWVSLTIQGGESGTVVGSIEYPIFNCGGDLILITSEPGILTLTEDITYSTFSCADGTVTLVLQSDGSLVFTGDYSDEVATGTLYPTP